MSMSLSCVTLVPDANTHSISSSPGELPSPLMPEGELGLEGVISNVAPAEGASRVP